MRTATVTRTTAETAITATVNLDGTGAYSNATGIGFLDHMLDQLARHSLIDVRVECKGDLHIDSHHTTEDSALALGAAVRQALGDRRGITRYGTAFAPMDEALARVAVDVSGRPFLVWRAAFTQAKLGDLDTELVEHFFLSFALEAGLTLHAELIYGHNNHHICEGLFKALARALRQAVEIDARRADAIPSTKGTLGG